MWDAQYIGHDKHRIVGLSLPLMRDFISIYKILPKVTLAETRKPRT